MSRSPDPKRQELLDGLYDTWDFLLRAGSAWENAPGETRFPLLAGPIGSSACSFGLGIP
jgi:hypothetical protein